MLPEHILQIAFASTTGEYAWRKHDLPLVARAVADAGLLILGGEAWIVRDGRFHGLIPLRDGTLAVFHWEPNTAFNLSWDESVRFAAEYTLNVIPDLTAEEEAANEYARDIWYCLTIVTPEEHDELVHSRR